MQTTGVRTREEGTDGLLSGIFLLGEKGAEGTDGLLRRILRIAELVCI